MTQPPTGPTENTAPAPASPALLRHDMESLLVYIQGTRIVSVAREQALSRIQGWLIDRFWVGVVTGAFGLILAWIVGGWLKNVELAYFIAGIVMILLSARMGAIVSIGRRLKNDDIGATTSADSIYALSTLGLGLNGLSVALISANVFGAVVYALFASGLPSTLGLSGGIAPSFRISAIASLQADAAEKKHIADNREEQATACVSPAAKPVAAASEAAGDGNSPDQLRDGNTSADVAGNESAGNSVGAVAPGPTPSATSTSPLPPEKTDCADQRGAARVAQKEYAEAQRKLDVERNTPSHSTNFGGWINLLAQIAIALGLASVADLFKLLLWAFIAGFFEQLVPDMLDNLAARGREVKAKEQLAAQK